MIDSASVECTSADEALAVLVVTPTLAEHAPENVTVTGVVRGPYSDASRTLPAEFKLSPNSEVTLSTKVVDPCYSTSDLMMEYELELWVVAREDDSTFKTRFELARKQKVENTNLR